MMPSGAPDPTGSIPEVVASRPYGHVQIKHVDWTIPGLVPSGMLTVLAGDPKLGKSLLLAAWASALSKQGKTSLLLSAEDAPEYTTKPRLMACEADERLIYHVDDHPLFGLSDENHWPARIRKTIESVSASLMVIDPFTAFMGADSDSHKDQHVRHALSPLREIAEDTQCAIIYVMHLNKTLGSNVLHRIVGSGAFGQIARSVVLMTAEETRKEPGRVVAHVSCNVAELAPAQLWNVEKIVLPEIGGRPVNTARLTYSGVIDVDTETLLAPRDRDDEGGGKLEKACELIGQWLEFNDMRSKELSADLAEHDISEKTAKRARSVMGVETEKRGSVWWVSLSQRKGAKSSGPTPLGPLDLPHNHAVSDGQNEGNRAIHEDGPLPLSPPSQALPDEDTGWGDDEGWETGR